MRIFVATLELLRGPKCKNWVKEIRMQQEKVYNTVYGNEHELVFIYFTKKRKSFEFLRKRNIASPQSYSKKL